MVITNNYLDTIICTSLQTGHLPMTPILVPPNAWLCARNQIGKKGCEHNTNPKRTSPWWCKLHDPWAQQEASLNWGRRGGFQSRQEILLHKPAHQQTTLRHLKVSLLIAQESNQNTNDYQTLKYILLLKAKFIIEGQDKVKKSLSRHLCMQIIFIQLRALGPSR